MRLSTQSRINETFKQGRRWTNGALGFSCLIRKDFRKRLVILIAKKNYPSAVDRNRLRRLVREAWKKGETMVQPGADLVITVRRGLNPKVIKFFDIEKMLLNGLKR